MTIEYSYIRDCTERTGVWHGEASEAVDAAADHLGAVPTGRGYIYLAKETDEAYRLTRADMLVAGAAILSDAADWYSIWCASTGTRLSDRTRDKYFSRQ